MVNNLCRLSLLIHYFCIQNFMARVWPPPSTEGPPESRVLNLTQKARASVDGAEGIQAGRQIGKDGKPAEPSEWYRAAQKRSQKCSGTLTWSQLSRACSNRLLSRQLCPCFLSCQRDRPSLPVCDASARPQDHTPESPGYTHFTYCLSSAESVYANNLERVLRGQLNTLLTDP